MSECPVAEAVLRRRFPGIVVFFAVVPVLVAVNFMMKAHSK